MHDFDKFVMHHVLRLVPIITNVTKDSFLFTTSRQFKFIYIACDTQRSFNLLTEIKISIKDKYMQKEYGIKEKE